MKIQIRDRDRRALIGLAVALLLYLSLSFVVLPAFYNLTTAAETAVEKEQDLQKYRRAVVRQGHYAGLLEQARNNLAAAEGRLIRGDNPSLASVEFQTLVEGAAVQAGIPLGQRSVSTAKKRDEWFNEITMTMSFECTPNQLTSFLAGIRGVPKFITVRNAQISPAQVLHEAPKGDFQKTIRVNLTLGAILASAPRVGA